MKPERNEQESILIAALERKPEIDVPADFRLRLRGTLAAEPLRRPARHPSFACATAYIAAACMAVALIVLTMLYPAEVKVPQSMIFVLEVLIIGQLMAVGFWLGTRSEG
jgi:type IV secretory pathway component VirB8